MKHAPLLLAVALTLAPACGEAPARDDRVGSFVVSLIEADTISNVPAYSKLLGVVKTAPTPPLVPLKLDQQVGDCQLLVPKNPVCAPDCAGGVCTENGICTPYPTGLDVGVVHINGLGPELDLSPVALTYQPVETLAHPPCAEGAQVGISASSFTIEGKCIPPFELTNASDIPVQTGQPVRLTWRPPGMHGISRVRLSMDVAHHGGKTGQIDCDVPDTGSFEIPASLVTRLVGLGLAGFPTINIGRISTAAALSAPNITFAMSSMIERPVDTGVVSCVEDTDCPTGQVCQPALFCR
jgi:hypothetical protein